MFLVIYKVLVAWRVVLYKPLVDRAEYIIHRALDFTLQGHREVCLLILSCEYHSVGREKEREREGFLSSPVILTFSKSSLASAFSLISSRAFCSRLLNRLFFFLFASFGFIPPSLSAVLLTESWLPNPPLTLRKLSRRSKTR